MTSAPDGAATELLGLLRRATDEAHQKIERSVRFLDADATTADYRDHLTRLWGFVAPMEERLTAACASAPLLELEARRKAHLLMEDLAALGLSDLARAALPRCPELPAVDGLQAALGCLYVLEGSTLGGRYIEHRLTELRPDTIATAHAYLRCYGRATGERWRAFLAALGGYARAPEVIVAAAQDTFVTLHRWLAAEGVS